MVTNTIQPPTALPLLPKDIVYNIADNLSNRDLYHLAVTCKDLNSDVAHTLELRELRSTVSTLVKLGKTPRALTKLPQWKEAINPPRNAENRPLFDAISSQKQEAALWLPDNGCHSLEKSDADRFSALTEAVMSYADGPKELEAKHRLIQRLIDGGADINVRSPGGQTPMFHAAFREDEGTLAMLLDHGADPRCQADSGDTVLHQQAKAPTRNPQSFERLVRMVPSILDLPNNRGELPIHSACAFHRPDNVAILSAYQIGIEARDNLDQTPLHLAITSGFRPQICEDLMTPNTLNAKDINQCTPLHLASQRLDPTQVMELLDQGSFVMEQDNDGNTPAHAYVQKMASHPDSELLMEPLQRFLEHPEFDVNSQNYDGKTILHLAGEGNHKQAFQMILATGGNLNIRDGQGRIPKVPNPRLREVQNLNNLTWIP